MPDSLIAGRPKPLPEGYEVVLVSNDQAVHDSAERLEYQVFQASGYVEENDEQRVLEYEIGRAHV